jgi:hypothetical protein
MVLAVVLGVAWFYELETPWDSGARAIGSFSEAVGLPLLLAVASAFAWLISAWIGRGLRGPETSLFFAFAVAASASALWLPAIERWSPSRWLVRWVIVEALSGHWATITVGVALLLFVLVDRRAGRLSDSRAAFGIELFPLLVWGIESMSNLPGLLESHHGFDRQGTPLGWYAEGTIAEMSALVFAVLFLATIAHLRAARVRPRGLPAALLGVATVLLDRAFALVLILPESALDLSGR